MGQVSRCGNDDCGGSLAPIFDGADPSKVNAYYCERCRTKFARIESIDEKPTGVDPQGRIDTGDEIAKLHDQYQAKLNAYAQREEDIAQMAAQESDDSEACRKILELITEPVEVPVA